MKTNLLKLNLIRPTSLLLALTMPWLSAQAQEIDMPPAQVEIMVVEEMNMAPQVEVPGTIISRNDAQIAAEVTGRVSWIAEIGTELEAGGIIAKIDDRTLQLQLQQALSDVKRLEASLKYQRKDVNRLRKLAKTGSVPASRLEQSVSQRDMGEQELAQAKITVERITYDLERTEVRAPYPGRVVERLVQLGEFSTIGRPVARFVDTVNIEIEAHVPVAAAGFLQDDQSVTVFKDQEIASSPVRAIIPVGDRVSRTFEIRVGVPQSSWIIGSAVRVAVPKSAPQKVIAVHRDALILRANSVSIFKIGADNKAEKVQVETGAAQGDYIVVKGLIEAGDQVIVRGGERLQPGRDVVVLGNS